jgi:hypothetical protein
MPEYLFHIVPLILIGVPLFFFCKRHLERFIKSPKKLRLAAFAAAVMLSAFLYFGAIILVVLYAHYTSEF